MNNVYSTTFKELIECIQRKTKDWIQALDKLHFVPIISIYHPVLVKETYMKYIASSQAMPTGKIN